jgi:hypothetical protein
MDDKVKITWSHPGALPQAAAKLKPDSTQSDKGKINIDRITVGHNQAEIFIRIADRTIILPPVAGKQLTLELGRKITAWEIEHGKIRETKGELKRRETVPKKVLKALYKSRKIGSKLISINTGKRKHLPDKDE